MFHLFGQQCTPSLLSVVGASPVIFTVDSFTACGRECVIHSQTFCAEEADMRASDAVVYAGQL